MDLFQMYQQNLHQNHPEEALSCLRQHLAANRHHAYGFFLAGNLLRDLGKLSEALSAFLEACRLAPDQSDFYRNLGVAFQDLQQPERAIEAFDIAYAIGKDPVIKYNRAMALLISGRYQEGWREYEWRTQVHKNKNRFKWHPAEKRWQGQPFPNQTLIVYREQGLGDSIQFCRYLPYIKALGGKVLFITAEELLPIFSTLDGVDQIIKYTPSELQTQKYHWAIPLMSLPYLCNTTMESIPNQTPYLSVPPAYKIKWKTLLAPYMSRTNIRNIGFVYATKDARRTIPLHLWRSLFSQPGLQWFSIQKGDAAIAIKDTIVNHPNIVDLTSHINDFADTAALLEQLDLLISTDTSVPHLAGALDKPTWLLLPFVIDWRWLLRRSDSPWYPSFRLFRQPGPGQWEKVLFQVKQELSVLVNKRN